jgi:hypothetical protein
LSGRAERQRLDRHALVVTIWFALGLVAVVLFERGLAAGQPGWVLVGMAVILLAFVGSVIVNAVYRTAFTAGELALGLVAYGTALFAFAVASLLSRDFREVFLLPLSLGFLALFGAVVFYMLAAFGVRRTFEGFDRIREFRSAGGGTGRPGGDGW